MNPDQILNSIYSDVVAALDKPLVMQSESLSRIELVSRNLRNRACVRVILACSLAKVYNPALDIRKPYTEIGDADAFSGRTFDERYISPFIMKHSLPCNPTTAFLTPALRNRNTVLTSDSNLSGKPTEVYVAMLQLLTDVYKEEITASQLLGETIRQLILLREEKKQRMDSLIANLKSSRSDVELSAEQIIKIIDQHMATKGASRLPVLVVAAAYHTASPYLRESVLPLEPHNSADSQTNSIGDVQVVLDGASRIVTCYEMKMRRVTTTDIDLAIHEKIARAPYAVDNYIFITTETIDREVSEYARSIYDLIGVEISVLDCISFLRHFLHLFHRHRTTFLDAYQALVLAEPESAVSQPLKEVFLTLRQAAESE